jgi:hypothetical protein
MSKIIWICSKNGFGENTKEKLNTIIDFITPDNIKPNPVKINIGSKVSYAVLNPKENIKFNRSSVCMGVLFGDYPHWYLPLNESPDGSFALFRESETHCEIISDATATRTVWYYHDEEQLIAATSQFAIIKYLGNFEFNNDIIPWMLTTGTLGPDLSWDKRIMKLPPDSSILLNQNSWKLELNINPIVFKSEKKSVENFVDEIKNKLNETIRKIDLDYTKWVLPLSGGYDSRGILFLLKNNNITPINTITWGLPASIQDPKSDGAIAKKLADKLEVNHSFHQTSFSDEPIERILERFIKNGEGRIDHISGYLDGFRLWKDLHERGINGIIRGDENFGWIDVYSKSDVLKYIGISFYYEFKNLAFLSKDFGFIQKLPNYLNQNKNETIQQWRDRLYHQFRLQTIISPLLDLKSSYVEQISPLLSEKIIRIINGIPDDLRNNKILWKKIVENFEPDVDFASSGAIANQRDILRSESFYDFLKSELQNINEELFDKHFLKALINKLKVEKGPLNHKENFSIFNTIKKSLNPKIYSFLKEKIRPKKNIDINVLAFRIVLINRVYTLLK